MNWRMIIGAVDGRSDALNWIASRAPDHEVGALLALLLLEEAPHAAAALIASAMAPANLAAPIQAALASHVAPALAAWRDDSLWRKRAIDDAVTRRRFAWGVAVMSGALHDHAAAQHDAVAIVLRDGDEPCIARCLEALGADGWRGLDSDLRAALQEKAPSFAFGWVWDALDDALRETAAEQAATDSFTAGRLIGAIGDAWRTTAPKVRARLINAVMSRMEGMVMTAPTWTSMTEDERETLVKAAITCDNAWSVCNLIASLGPAGRATLTDAQRATLESCAPMSHTWDVLRYRAADVGWTSLSVEERGLALAEAERTPWRVSALLGVVGAAQWGAMREDERSRLIAAVRHRPDVLFACPPALWGDLADGAAPPARRIMHASVVEWRAEDAAADLSRLSAAHQAVVLALAPWRRNDGATNPARGSRLLALWGEMTADEQAEVGAALPLVLAVVAACARRRGGGTDAINAVGNAVAQSAAMTADAESKRMVGAMLCSADDWRDWMGAFAPTDADSSEVWDAWEHAAQRGLVPDVAIGARLAARRQGRMRDRGAFQRM